MLKKTCLLLLCWLVIGCRKPVVNSNLNQEKYEAYYQSILDNENFIGESQYFSIVAIMNKIDDQYRYSVIVDNPQIAMYNIEMMAIIDDGSVSINKNIVMPASGLFDRSNSMIPWQTNEPAGFPAGIVLDGVCDVDKIDLLVLVAWKNADGTESYREYFRLLAAYSNPVN